MTMSCDTNSEWSSMLLPPLVRLENLVIIFGVGRINPFEFGISVIREAIAALSRRRVGVIP